MSDTVVTFSGKGKPPKPGRYAVGDVVQLRSGGHHMVVRTATDKRVSADWHNDYGDLTTADFTPEMLMPAVDELQIEVEPDDPGYA